LHDVLNNIADNLSRRTEKASAMELIRDSAIVRRGSIQQAARAMEPLERMKQVRRVVIREVDRVRARGQSDRTANDTVSQGGASPAAATPGRAVTRTLSVIAVQYRGTGHELADVV